MQLNIYIPKEKARILTILDQLAETTKRPKNELILEALERYLPGATPEPLKKFSLGNVKAISRADIYEGRFDR